MTEQLFNGEHYIDPRYSFMKDLIRAYKYGSLNPDIVITGHDYQWFKEQIQPIIHKLGFYKKRNGRRRYLMTPKEVQYIYDLLGKPTIIDNK